MPKKQPIPIESIVPLYDKGYLWADLGPYFNGYQISNRGIVRSMKFYKKYPYGILIEPDENGNVYLSNSLNKIEQVNVKEVMSVLSIMNFTIQTDSTYTRSRNPIITSQSKLIKKKSEFREELKKPSNFHFKIKDKNDFDL